jgi:4-amino-4-deoxy-L-arabinose transferase-like glycosyltransferase
MSSTENLAGGDRRARAIEVLALVLAVALVVVPGLMVPGLGLAIGLAIAFIGYRHDRRKRNAFVALGAAVSVVAVGLWLFAAWPAGSHAPSQSPPVHPGR